MTKIFILNDNYKLATGPNGNVYITVKRKPNLCYALESAEALGLIAITGK